MSISRRRFIAVAGGVFGAAVGADAFAVEPARVLVSRHDVPVRGLAPDLDGVRIAQVTDVHFPGNVEAAQATLGHLRRERPEIVVLTGDMTEHRSALPQVAEFAAAARGSIATVATLGNWEYKCQATDRAEDTYRNAGVELLVNGKREVRVGGASVVLVGLDDPVLGRPDVHRARAGLRSGSTEIWLVHAPGFMSWPRTPISGTPLLVLAGHTHGGQVRFPLVPALTPEGSGRFVAGWYRDTFAPLYVSRGIGTTTIPVRFRCPPELPIFTLRGA
jgi:predicted MPP superfamily phosphohydrolase